MDLSPAMAPKRRRPSPRTSPNASSSAPKPGDDGDGEVTFKLPPPPKKLRMTPVVPEVLPEPRRSPNGFLLPDPVPRGFVLTDNSGGGWVVGGVIGTGGFGEIYAARRSSGGREDFVVKVEPHSNGPLFVEVNFYLSAAREEQLEEWRTERGLSHVGVAQFVASGSLMLNGKKFRFLVLPRFGADLQSVIDAVPSKSFAAKTVCSLAVQVVRGEIPNNCFSRSERVH